MVRNSKRIFEELEAPIHMRIYTRVPTKWILIDSETGEVYQGNVSGYWDKLLRNDKNIPEIIPPDFPSHSDQEEE